MPKSAADRGRELLAGAPLSESERAKVEAVLAGPDADKFLTFIGEAGLRQDDYSTRVTEARAAEGKFNTLYEQNVEWFNGRKADLDELEEYRTGKRKPKAGDPDPNPDPPLPEGVVLKKDLDTTLSQLEAGALGVMADLTELSAEHFKRFGEVLNPRQILGDKRVQQLGIRGVYEDLNRDRIKALTDAEQKKRDDALREEGAKQERERLAASRHPYPVTGQEPSTLDALVPPTDGKAPAAATVDQMVENFARLNANRTGATH